LKTKKPLRANFERLRTNGSDQLADDLQGHGHKNSCVDSNQDIHPGGEDFDLSFYLFQTDVGCQKILGFSLGKKFFC